MAGHLAMRYQLKNLLSAELCKARTSVGFEKAENEVVVTCLKVLSRYTCGGTEEDH